MPDVKELKPCPFCGGDAECEGYDYAYFARCLDRECIASVHGCHFEDAAQAIAAWNRRSDSSLRGRVEVLEKALKHIAELRMGRGDGVVGDYIEEIQETARAALTPSDRG